MGVARVGRLDDERHRPCLYEDRRDLGEIDIVVVRPS